MKVGMVCASVAFVSAIAFGGVTVNWTYREGVGLSPDAAAQWAAPENWDCNGQKVVPTSEDTADLSATHDGVVYIRILDGASVLKLFGTGSSGTAAFDNVPVLLCDGAFTTSVNRATGFRGVKLYGDWSNSANTYAGNDELAGNILPCPTFTLVSGQFKHRLDLYADDMSAVRSGVAGVTNFYMSTGGYVLYAPEGCGTNVVGQWRLTDNSPYVSRTGAAHLLVPGQVVTAGNGLLPAHTFVKRILNDSLVELSASATTSALDPVDAELTFEAFEPVVHEHVPTFTCVTDATGEWYGIVKRRQEDTAIFEVDSLTPQGTAVVTKLLDMREDGCWPGKFVFHDALRGELLVFKLATCHVELGAAATSVGLSKVTFLCNDSRTVATVSVADGIAARLGKLSCITGFVTKAGAGTLATALDGGLENSGTLTVAEGRLELQDSDGGAAIGNLVLNTGAVLKLPPSGLTVGGVTVSGPTTIEGPGLIVVPPSADLSEVTFVNGAKARFVTTESTSLQLTAPTYPTAPIGNPALWIDVSAAASTVPNYDGTADFPVRRINDVRGSAYAYAETAAGEAHTPKLVLDVQGRPHHIYFKEIASATTPAETEAMVWDKPIRGIRAVFKVVVPSNGGGVFLGSTSALSVPNMQGDFMRPAQTPWNGGIVFNRSDVSACVREGKWYINGQAWDFTQGYAYPGNGPTENPYTPQVVESHPNAPGAAADCFDYVYGGATRNGRERLCECVVYTNVLSETERQQVAGYLMKKWLNSEIEYRAVPDGGVAAITPIEDGELYASDGQTIALGEVVGDETFVKSGDGEVQLLRYVNDKGGLKVSGGTLTVVSPQIDESVLPGGAFVHLDASKGTTITHSADENKKVTKWSDVDGGPIYCLRLSGASGDYPRLKENVAGLLGKSTIDMGPFQDGAAASAKSALRFISTKDTGAYKTNGLHTVICVMGSGNGGGSIVGETDGTKAGDAYDYDSIYGVFRAGTHGAAASDPLVLSAENYTGHPNFRFNAGVFAQINGSAVDPTTTGLSGSYDVVSFVSRQSFGTGGIGMNSKRKYTGGMDVAEYLLYPMGLCSESLRKIDAYLRQKWFGVTPQAFLPAEAGRVTVDEGATLNVVGSSMTVGSISGAGTVKGALVLAQGATCDVEVAADGSVDTLTVDGTVDFSRGGTVTLSGDVRKLATGRHVLVSCPNIDPATSGQWTVLGVPKNRTVTVRVILGALVIDVERFGIVLIVR